MSTTNDDRRGAVAGPVDQPVRPTHWMDDRGYVLTTAQREAQGYDWKMAYNVPCRMRRGRAKPLYKCARCGGAGHDMQYTHDPCGACGRSGGLPGPNAEVTW